MSSFPQPLQPAETETDSHRPRGPVCHLKARGRLAGRDRWISLPRAAAAIRSVSPLHPKRPDPKFSRRLSVANLTKSLKTFCCHLSTWNPYPSTTTTNHPLVTVAACASGTTPLSPFLLVVSSFHSPASPIAMASAAPSTGSTKVDAVVQKAAASAPGQLSGVQLYSRFALAGAVCCSITHGALTPVDVYVASS